MVEPKAPYGPVPAEKAGNALISNNAARTEDRAIIFFINILLLCQHLFFLWVQYSSRKYNCK